MVYSPLRIYVLNVFLCLFGDKQVRDFNQGGPRRNFGPREMHKATCAECGQECEVPFKPKEDRPVYCKACYTKKRNA
ncbi:MAG: DNA-directed RNA polymerase [Planctomycetes bacterium]|nr:DNA-directed RNA polymerase [Planctomycetota bacterium]MBU1518948.1 DNA-directed RNA polymerase [Planctomycetota bacterium]MBU2457939.1 DNA-directed RNA polymerase [Planctomycetota bacterium]